MRVITFVQSSTEEKTWALFSRHWRHWSLDDGWR